MNKRRGRAGSSKYFSYEKTINEQGYEKQDYGINNFDKTVRQESDLTLLSFGMEG